MKTYSSSWICNRFTNIKNKLGVSEKDLAKILGIDPMAIIWLLAVGRVDAKHFPLEKIKELDSLIKLGSMIFPRGEFKRWLRKEHLPIYAGSCPLNYLKQGDYEMVRYSLKMEDF